MNSEHSRQIAKKSLLAIGGMATGLSGLGYATYCAWQGVSYIGQTEPFVTNDLQQSMLCTTLLCQYLLPSSIAIVASLFLSVKSMEHAYNILKDEGELEKKIRE